MRSKLLAILVVVSLGLIAVGGVREYGPDLSQWITWGVQTPTAAYIVHESGDDPKLPPSQIILLAKAPDVGVKLIDQNIKGKGKQLSAELQPYLDAARDKPLPQLVRAWSSGRITSVPCPATFDELRKAVGR